MFQVRDRPYYHYGVSVSYTHLDVYKRQAKYSELTLLSQTLQDEKSPVVILRTTQRKEHLTRRMKNLLNWPNITVIPPDVQSFADEALQKLPAIIRQLRRRSDSFRMDEIEKSLKKLYISPVQSPTLEQPPPNTDQESPTVSKIQPSREQNPNRDVNTQTIFEAPPPSGSHNRSGMYELTTPNAASGPPKGIPLVNYNVDLYGKITHPVEKLLAEIPYTDGLNVTKLLNFIKYLLQICLLYTSRCV